MAIHEGGCHCGKIAFTLEGDIDTSHVGFLHVGMLKPEDLDDDHPMRPAQARTNDAFWAGRGYAPLPGVHATFSWRDIGAPAETVKTLQVWFRKL